MKKFFALAFCSLTICSQSHAGKGFGWSGVEKQGPVWMKVHVSGVNCLDQIVKTTVYTYKVEYSEAHAQFEVKFTEGSYQNFKISLDRCKDLDQKIPTSLGYCGGMADFKILNETVIDMKNLAPRESKGCL